MKQDNRILQLYIKDRIAYYESFLVSILDLLQSKILINNFQEPEFQYLLLLRETFLELDIKDRTTIKDVIVEKLKNIKVIIQEVKKYIDESKIMGEINQHLLKRSIKKGALIIEFDNFDYAKPFVRFYGNSHYDIKKGQTYVSKWGPTLGWFQSEVDWSFIFMEIQQMRWLDEEHGITEIEHGLLEMLKFKVFMVYSKLINNFFSSNPNSTINNLHIYIGEQDIEPYSIYVQ